MIMSMSTTATPVRLGGTDYVIVPRTDYDQLIRLVKAAELPAPPEPDAEGNYPAVEYARASLARNIIRDRASLGLSQRELAEMAGIRVETLCRLEKGRHTPSLPTLNRIDRALKRVAAPQKSAGRGGKRKGG